MVWHVNNKNGFAVSGWIGLFLLSVWGRPLTHSGELERGKSYSALSM